MLANFNNIASSNILKTVTFMAVSGFCLVSIGGCAATTKPYQPTSSKERTVFMPSLRTVAPEPIYARTRWVRAPQVLPQRDVPSLGNPELRDSPTLRPVFEINIKDATLEETARILSATARYSSYTAPSIANNKISLKNLGTIDELGRIIESKAQVQVIIDHENKEVRFLPASAQSPRLFEE